MNYFNDIHELKLARSSNKQNNNKVVLKNWF